MLTSLWVRVCVCVCVCVFDIMYPRLDYQPGTHFYCALSAGMALLSCCLVMNKWHDAAEYMLQKNRGHIIPSPYTPAVQPKES